MQILLYRHCWFWRISDDICVNLKIFFVLLTIGGDLCFCLPLLMSVEYVHKHQQHGICNSMQSWKRAWVDLQSFVVCSCCKHYAPSLCGLSQLIGGYIGMYSANFPSLSIWLFSLSRINPTYHSIIVLMPRFIFAVQFRLRSSVRSSKQI